jgi:uncharacterized membrane protein
MEKKSKTSNRKKLTKKISSEEEKISLDKIAEILGVPEDELKKLPDHVLKRIKEISVEEESYYRGPIPPPSLVSEYEKILPGSFDRILKLTEGNAQHRIEIDKHKMGMEKKLVPESIKLRRSGQNKAFFISILGIIAVVFCAFIGQTTIGSILAGTTLISLVPNFIAGIKKDKEKQNKIKKID